MNIQNTTRRSFMKKTTALAVGISVTTLFSGLVHGMIVSKLDTGLACQRKDVVLNHLNCFSQAGGDGKYYYTCTGNGGQTIQCKENPDIVGDITYDNPEDWIWCPIVNGKTGCDQT
ncbi:MAG: twin-arginine translocation signal domain-containing protein [Luteolibacter sp.]|uniref:twin-arginine translocation signal domain-containing protein n=1 Tax=Luteolibacter sp. TaxID=1962973 RepID=UPI003267C7D5